MQRSIPLVVSATAALFLTTTPCSASAARFDGFTGPWADLASSYRPGPQVDGQAVRASRLDPEQAVGRAEASAEEGTFTSLGLGGQIVLAFANPVCDLPGPDIRVIEATRGVNSLERGQVDVSSDGRSWNPALRGLRGTYDGDLPDAAGVVRFVRITDVSSLAAASAVVTADGFDVDGVAAIHATAPCPAGADGDDPTMRLPAAEPATVVAARPANEIGVLGVRTQVCGSQRRFGIRLRVPRPLTARLRDAAVWVAGRRVDVRFTRGRYRAVVDLRGLRKGRYTIRIEFVDRRGRTASAIRRYRTCTPGRRTH